MEYETPKGPRNMMSPPQSPAQNGRRTNRPDAAKAMTVFVLIVATLYFGREVLVPITLALLLTFLLAPLVNWFRRIYFGRVPAVLLVVTLALAVLVGIGGVIGSQLKELASDLPKYASTIEGKVDSVKLETFGRLSHAMNFVAPRKSPAAPAATSAQAPAQQARHVDAPAKEAMPLAPPLAPPQAMPTPWELAEQYISPLLSPLATLGIVFVVAVFALLQREDLRDRLIRLIGPDDIHRTTLALDDAGRRLTRYFLTQLGINAVFGLVICIGLYYIGVPRPVLWGVLTAVLRFIPYVGSFISALLPIALAAAVEPGWSMALWTLAFYAIAEGLTGQIVEPLVYGQSSGLSPFSVIVAAIFWSWVWGPVGLFLSTPLTLCLAVMGRHVRGLEFLDIALGDRPALTRTESFYQRILADDADEVLAQAELMLKDMPLARYFDQVALPGMQLAANDVELGILTADQQESVKATIYELVAGLSEHQGQKKPDDQPGKMVLSIAGRGPLDEPAAAMLAHVLDQRGMDSRLIKYRDVSRYGIDTLDTAHVALVCIAYLNISGSPAHLRYLVQRLRKHFPATTPIIVGLWPENDSATKDAQATIGADDFVSSFEEVLQHCQTIMADGDPANETLAPKPA
jgi:predicted PurR-regulated permease PerM